MTTFTRNWPRLGLALAAFGLAAAPLAAQVETIDPNNAIDGDLVARLKSIRADLAAALAA